MTIANNDRRNTAFITVDFILHAEKQHTLIELLKTHSSFDTNTLSNLLNVSPNKLNAVLAKKRFLSLKEAERLAKYFCVFCGS